MLRNISVLAALSALHPVYPTPEVRHDYSRGPGFRQRSQRTLRIHARRAGIHSKRRGCKLRKSMGC